MRERTITLEIQPDNIPEDDEVRYTVVLGMSEIMHLFCRSLLLNCIIQLVEFALLQILKQL